jgi:glycerate-2-kinase
MLESDRAERAFLEELYAGAVAAAAPGAALERGMAGIIPRGPVRIFALGKAALPMAETVVAVLARLGLAPAGGIVVPPADAAAPHRLLPVVPGDHPEPGPRSRNAAEALGRAAAATQEGDEAWVLLSGGTSSLLGAPVAGVRAADLTALYALLLGSGLDISAMNKIRKRFSRWGGGRLAIALGAADRVRVFVVSDVIGDDLPSIGSGPCVPDPSRAAEVREALNAAGLTGRTPPALLALLAEIEMGRAPETPKPDDPAFARVEHLLIASNRLALEAAATVARQRSVSAEIVAVPLAGEASAAGRSIAATLLRRAREPVSRRRCVIWGGETTVTLGAEPPGMGGRSQELALAAAGELARANGEAGVWLLAAGTDGRDGPTDAAGAIVDGSTWDAIRRAGRDPARDLATHDAYRALEAAGALIRPGLTGTNVMDLVIGLC